MWEEVRRHIESALGDLKDIDIQIYEPTNEYQNITKSSLPPKFSCARTLLTELIRNYLILGMDCTLLEVQKLAWFLERTIKLYNLSSPLKLQFKPERYGPYADNLRHLLNNLEGFLLSDKKINDCGPFDNIWFNNKQKETLESYLANQEIMKYKPALEFTLKFIDGFESPFGMELLATIDWLITEEDCPPNVKDILAKLSKWKSNWAAKRKLQMFKEEHISKALERLQMFYYGGGAFVGMAAV